MKSITPISIIQNKVRKMLGPPIYQLIFKLIDLLGFWRYPADLDQTQIHQKILNRIYWMYKWYRPIINPENGSAWKHISQKSAEKLINRYFLKAFSAKDPWL